MKNIRIEPINSGSAFLIDVVCDCGQNALQEEKSGRSSFKHEISLGGHREITLICTCGNRYRVRPQLNHFHVFSLVGSSPKFENPTGYWEYTGSFTVELTPDAPRERIPVGVTVSDDDCHILINGRVRPSTGGIQFEFGGMCFSWPYRFIKEIRIDPGSLIWKNREY